MENKMDKLVEKKDEPYSFIMENTWLKRKWTDFGWGNGYVAIPKDHPWYNLHFDEIENVEINGGLTFSEMVNDMWVIGFDTAHSWDSLAMWPQEMVQHEADRLLSQVSASSPPAPATEGKDLKTDLERRIENLEHDPLRTVYGPPPRDPEEDRKEMLAFIESTKQMPEAKFVPTPPAGAEGEGEIPFDVCTSIYNMWQENKQEFFFPPYQAGAMDMWRKMQGGFPPTQNPEASYWFEKSRQNLVDRNDFKGQLSAAHTKIAELEQTIREQKEWMDSHL